jgi:hypothetical protein
MRPRAICTSSPQNSAVPATRRRSVPTGITARCKALSTTGVRGAAAPVGKSNVIE